MHKSGLIVKSLTINGKEHPLKYRYLPVSLVDKIKSIRVNNKSVWERGVFYQDALKIIKNNLFFGLGGNAWRYEYEKVQSYQYGATEIHSYPLQILMDYGIISFIALFYIVGIIVKHTIVYENEESFGIYISILLLLAHSFIDFDMSFFYIMLMWFSLLGICNAKEKVKKE